MCPCGDLEASVVVHIVLVELRQLLEHAADINDNAVAEDILAARVQDATWEKMERVLDAVSDDGVSRVSSTVEASTNVVILRQDVHKLALAFVAPLRSEDDAKARVEASIAALTSFGQRSLETHIFLSIIYICRNANNKS